MFFELAQRNLTREFMFIIQDDKELLETKIGRSIVLLQEFMQSPKEIQLRETLRTGIRDIWTVPGTVYVNPRTTGRKKTLDLRFL